jgi:hypothetical protein
MTGATMTAPAACAGGAGGGGGGGDEEGVEVHAAKKKTAIAAEAPIFTGTAPHQRTQNLILHAFGALARLKSAVAPWVHNMINEHFIAA